MHNRVVKALDRAEDVILAVMLVVMVGAIFLQVVMRYVFNNSLSWSEELGKFMFIWISWIGISIGQRRGEHIKIEMLTGKLPYKAAMICSALSDAIVISICAVTAYYGLILVFNQQTTNYAGIYISISWGYLSVAFGCTIMILRCIVTITGSLRSFISGAPPDGGNSIESSTGFVKIDDEGRG